MVKRKREDSVTYKGRMYSTLDFTASTTTTVGTQTGFMKMPDGWCLAEVNEDIIQNVIAKYPWGAVLIACADGNAYFSSYLVARAGDKYNWSESEHLIKQSPTGLKPRTTKTRILISKPVEDVPAKRVALANAALWDEKPFADCEVICGDTTTPCHRAVLAVASPVFKQMLTVQMKEATSSSVTVREAKPSVVESLLRFAYTGAIPEHCDHIFELLALADQYQMVGLVSLCAEEVLNEVTDENVLSIIRAVRNHRDHEEVKDIWTRLLELLAARTELLSTLAISA
eukprot:TRINITY_DN27747_c0_g2_i2.p1 TRINITY_DN27747_c0_g2~~TRINITY_DN27747_c0_g2_i2.p1  ORF type:complete len:285 (+),score=22.98 TRINITY_DN27747_c0_g2_i2:183-1037(+)